MCCIRFLRPLKQERWEAHSLDPTICRSLLRVLKGWAMQPNKRPITKQASINFIICAYGLDPSSLNRKSPARNLQLPDPERQPMWHRPIRSVRHNRKRFLWNIDVFDSHPALDNPET